jgi:deoxyhypusine synthase
MEESTKKTVRDLADKNKSELSFPEKVRGPMFESRSTLETFVGSYRTIGFQATNVGLAIEEIARMRTTKIFFGCTSSIISSGLRDVVAHIARHRLVDVMVISGGGIEEDITKTLLPHRIASFDLQGKVLRENGLNRVGNLVIPNENYFELESWLTGVLDGMLEGRSAENPLVLTPSSFIKILGARVENESSVLHWAARNDIPIYSPAVTDGSIGDILTFYHKRQALKLDIVEDTCNMNREAMFEEKTGAIILGGGLIKHHVLNANLFKNGVDHCVLVNTASDFDGSDAGANIEEAVSWGKVKSTNTAVKVFGDATLVFPLLVAGSFLSGTARE